MVINSLKNTFKNTALKYNKDETLIERLWTEIEKLYSDKNRYYHNLQHLKRVLDELYIIKSNISDWDTIIFATFYHDAIYDIRSANNEEDSANLSKIRLQQLGFPKEKIDQCAFQILATKKHIKTLDQDTNIFIDADLSILGQKWEIYSEYYKQIRQEFSFYIDAIYNNGRKNILEQTLEMECIFKTEHFFTKLEKQARSNINKEIQLLTP